MTFEERNETELSPDDPRITAYAFGELEGDERASMEAAVARDPALRAAVAELRAFGGELGATLADELATGPEKSLHAAADRARNRGRVLRFPVWAWAFTTRMEAIKRVKRAFIIFLNSVAKELRGV